MQRVVIPLAVVVAAAGVAGWWFWPRAAQNPGARQTVAGSRDASAVANAAPPPALLTLQVNDATKADVAAGVPLFFSVSVTGTSPQQTFRIGAPGRSWFADLRFETGDGKPVPMKLEQLGSTDTDDSRVHRVDFAVAPDESGRLAAGAYDVRVVLPLASAPEGIKQLVSNTVSVSVAPASSGSQLSPEQERVRLEAAARFYLQSQNWEAAHRLSLQLVERQDAGPAAFILLGDSLNGLRRDSEALAAYQDAMAALPRDLKESPDYLIARMHQVRARQDPSVQNGKR